jgi:hypothetical protein
MRSLEKVAYDKGWVKPEPLVRTSSPKAPNLAPTDNLMTNILKLCAGLRGTQSMEKYADELETCYLNYKSAQTMYDAHGEKGEDVIHSAHPKGSHKLEGVDSSEAVFEDILDQHVKSLQMIEKKPSGKLSDAAQIMGAVKKALGAETTLDELYATAGEAFQKFRRLYFAIVLKLGEEGTYNEQFLDAVQNYNLGQKKIDSSIRDSALVSSLDGLKEEKAPGMLSGGTARATWANEILPIFKIAYRYAEQFRDAIAKIRTLEARSVQQSTTKEFDPESLSVTPISSDPTTSGVAQQLLPLYNEITQSIGQSKTKAATLPNGAALSVWFDKAQQLAKTTFELGFQQAAKNPAAAQQLLSKLTDIKAKVDRAQQKLSV